jgi:hypothetical protein
MPIVRVAELLATAATEKAAGRAALRHRAIEAIAREDVGGRGGFLEAWSCNEL